MAKDPVASRNHYLYETPKESLIEDLEDKTVARCLDVINQGEEVQGNLIDRLKKVREAVESAYSTEDPDGEVFMESKFARNVCEKVLERIDFLNFDIEPMPPIENRKEEDAKRQRFIAQMKAQGVEEQKAIDEYVLKKDEEEQQRINMRNFRKAYLKAGIIQILKEAKWYQAFQGKGGVFQGIVYYGNKFARVVEGDTFPIKIETYDSDCVHVKRNVRSIRDNPDGKNARQLALTVRMDYDDYGEMVAKGDNKKLQVMPGLITNTGNKLKSTEHNDTPEREIEVATYFDLQTESQALIVGGAKSKIEELSGAAYPHKKHDKPIIPLAHFRGIPSLESFYDWGVGHYVVQLSNVKKIIENKTIFGVIQEINPLWYIQGTAGGRSVFQRLAYEAEEARAVGSSALIYDEPNAAGGYSTGTGVHSLSGKTVSNINEIVEQLVERNTIDFGVSMKEVETNAEKTATALTIEQEAANLLISIISKTNAPEVKFLLEMVVDAAKRLVPDNNKTRVDTSMIEVASPEEQKILDNLTIGKVIKELKQTEVAFKMEVMSGVAQSPALEQAKLNSLLQLSAGRPVSARVLKQIFDRNGFTVDESELTVQNAEADNNKTEQPV